MYYRLVRLLLGVLVLVAGTGTSAAAVAARGGEDDRAPIVVPLRGGDSALPFWLAWLRSLAPGGESEQTPPTDTGTAEDEGDAGPSMDPNG